MQVRAFFAVDLEDEAIKKKITDIQSQLTLPDTRIAFVIPENLHFTMKFIGDLEEKLIPEIQTAAEKIKFNSFEMDLNGLGCLPNLSYINAIYVGVTKGFTELSKLASKIEDLSGQFNFKKENRPFRAHLTIGRVKRIQDKDPLINKLKENEKTEFGKIIVNSFKLKKSVRTPDGPVYTNLFEVKSTD
ncbi:MAG: RNA 2',3'-cyclic phosphodiesterase [Candidatus Heimdallarchaeota archaeon]|jgi:2'-5' RNA ligase|nr:RNA 2',3'-cyclic phosphodiesterase [Candidatus Heimdallarchaeota archaeon]MBY8994519.1 RNA 2',3'-cyclic phosphodiesterase [Candidatus Heimdallarchaeota archaeon]